MRHPPSFTNASELAARIEAYFDQCMSSKREYPLKNGSVQVRYTKPPTIAGLAVHLGVHKDTVYSYMSAESKTGVSSETTKDIAETLTRARDRIEAFTVEAAMSGDIDAKTAQLILGGFGYANKTEEKSVVTVKITGADSKAVEEWSQ